MSARISLYYTDAENRRRRRRFPGRSCARFVTDYSVLLSSEIAFGIDIFVRESDAVKSIMPCQSNRSEFAENEPRARFVHGRVALSPTLDLHATRTV